MVGKLRNAVKQKGQGILEYALLLAFVVGIAMMLNGANLGSAVMDAFDSVASLLGGEKKGYAWALENLSGLSKDEIRKIIYGNNSGEVK